VVWLSICGGLLFGEGKVAQFALTGNSGRAPREFT
jgi:hypothetical protein